MDSTNSTRKTNGYIDVDSLQQELVASGDVVERIASFYNVDLPALHKTQNETRMACIFACGKREEQTGDRAIFIKTKQDGAVFRCFQYGCTVRGNLLNLMFLIKHDREPTNGKLKGTEFKEIASDLQALLEGRAGGVNPLVTLPSQNHSPQNENSLTHQINQGHYWPGSPTNVSSDDHNEPLINIPLKDSENERARELVNLDDKFITDVAEMSPQAAAYVRSRQFMTPETMKNTAAAISPVTPKDY